jgi:Holliday junction resolvase RusA-like endonuclease
MAAEISFAIPGEPCAFARAGANGKRRYTPPKQASFMAAVKLFASRAMAGAAPMQGPVEMTVEAIYLAPASWSKTKRELVFWKTSRADADNIAKLVSDAINEIVFVDDAQVARLSVTKHYGDRSVIIVSVRSMECCG